VKPDGTADCTSGTTGAEFGLVREKNTGGWLRLIHNPDYRYRKHTALGRFRHENIALRVDWEKISCLHGG